MPEAKDHTESSDKARSRGRSETERDDKTMFATVRENSDIGIEESWSANVKRMFDEYQHESLESIRRARAHFDKLMSDAQAHADARQHLATQALQNAVETANMIGKQAVAHRDLAIHHEWGKHEQVDDPGKK